MLQARTFRSCFMKPIYSHIPDGFPNVEDVDAYKYTNEFDYKKFDTTQMRITICSVPWDVGLIHVGNAQIGGLGNVVYFETEQRRDEYLDSIEDKFTAETKYRRFHAPEEEIVIPIPFDVVTTYNYCFIDYTPLPVAYEDPNKAITRFCYFIRDCEMAAPSTTKVTLMRDSFQTYIYRTNITRLMLSRGHAPLSKINATDYLKNPLENTRYVMGEDVNYGADSSLVSTSESIVLNDKDTYACIVTNANPKGTWGAKANDTWNVPGYSNHLEQGVPANYCFAVGASNLNSFLSNIDAQTPQFKETIQGIFFANEKLITLGDAFNFVGISCYEISATQKRLDLLTLTKDKFGYDSKYSELAKLYTYPYAHIEITDEKGNLNVIRIEDTNGKLKLDLSLSIAWPWITTTAQINGLGSSTNNNLSFTNVSSRSFNFCGRWYDTLLEWNIPIFAVVQANNITNDYATHFDRKQQALQNITNQTNALESAATAQSNNLASNDTVYNNQANNIQRIKDNVDRELQLQAAIKNRNNNVIDEEAANNETKLEADMNTDLATSVAVTAVENEVTAITATHNQAMGIVGQAGMGAITGATAGSIIPGAGTIGGAVIGGIGGAVGGIVGAEQIGFSATVSMSSNDDMARASRDNTMHKKAHASAHLQESTRIRKNYNNETLVANNQAVLDISARNKSVDDSANSASKSTGDANTNRTKTTQDGIANRNKAISDSAITNSIAQAALRPINQFGTYANGQYATTRPLACFANIVTQAKGAIEAAGDEFLRYGYKCNLLWEFETFNLMPHFTYWQASDISVASLSVPDAVMDEIRFYLLGGVCVWKNPEDIGRISIYDN